MIRAIIQSTELWRTYLLPRSGAVLRVAVGMAICILADTPARGGQVVDAIRLDTMPAIDGHIDLPFWGDDGWHGGFRSIRDLAVAGPAIETRFKLGYTATHLVAAIRCARPGVDAMPPAETEPGGPVWGDEGVEIFLAPAGPEGAYYQIGINAWGVATALTQPGDTGWAPDIVMGTSRDAEGWSLELAIPFVAMDVAAPTPTDGDIASVFARSLGPDGELLDFDYRQRDAETGGSLAWRFNVARNSGGHWSFSPFRGGYHQPAKFAAVSFVGSGVWPLTLDADSARLTRTDRFLFEQAVTYHNPTDQTQEIALRAAFEDSDVSIEMPARVPPDTPHTFKVRLPVDRMGDAIMTLTLQSVQDDGVRLPLRVDRLARAFRELPIAVAFQLPYQRAVLYASQPLDTVHARIKLDASHAGELGRTVIVNLHDAEGRELAAESVELENLEQDVALPIPPLAPGRYRLTAWSAPEGFTFFQQSIVIDLLPRAANEWVLSSDGGLVHNGNAFRPRGFISGLIPVADALSREQLQRLADGLGANVHVAAGVHGLDDEALAALLDRHLESGLFVVIPPAPLAPERIATPLSEAEAAAIRARVRRLRDHDALLGWLVAYAPGDRIGTRERVARITSIVIEEDPYRPLISVHDSMPSFRGFSAIGDVRLLAPPVEKCDALQAAAVLDTWVDTLSQAAGPPFWISAGLPRERPGSLTPDASWRLVTPAVTAGAGGLFVPLTGNMID